MMGTAIAIALLLALTGAAATTADSGRPHAPCLGNGEFFPRQQGQGKERVDVSLTGVSLREFQIVPSHRSLFCGIPKNGVSSMSRFTHAFGGDPDEWDYYHNAPGGRHHDYGKDHGEMQHRMQDIMGSPRWHKAVMLRDPHERFLDGYLSKCGENPENKGSQCVHCKPVNSERALCSFSELVDLVSRKGTTMNPHFLPQSECCGNLGNSIAAYDFVGRVTNRTSVRRQYMSMCDMLPRCAARKACTDAADTFFPATDAPSDCVGPRVGGARHCRGAVGRLREMYSSKDLWEKVRKVYEADFRLFRHLTPPGHYEPARSYEEWLARIPAAEGEE